MIDSICARLPASLPFLIVATLGTLISGCEPVTTLSATGDRATILEESPRASASPKPTSSATPTPTPFATPTPTATAAPTATPTPAPTASPTFMPSPSPTTLPNLNRPSVTSGDNFSCGVSAAGGAYCWGANPAGQLGNGTTSASATPVQVKGVGGTGFLAGLNSIKANRSHVCALSNTGGVYCWGDNDSGQLGNGTTVNSTTPVQVKGVGGTGLLSGIVAIAVGGYHSCALSSGGNVFCWGNNVYYGQLGTNSQVNSTSPTQVLGPAGSGVLSNITAISAAYATSCALNLGGSVYCWGWGGSGQLGSVVSGGFSLSPLQVPGPGGTGALSNVISVSIGDYQLCAATSAGTVYCSGWNNVGGLGNGTFTRSDTLVQVLGIGGAGVLSGIQSVSSGAYHVCGINAAGNLACWGNNGNGELGNNTSQYNSGLNTAVTTLGVGGTGILSGITSVAPGNFHTCARAGNGNVYCMGYGANGQLGVGSGGDAHTPVQVLGVGGTGFLSL